MKNFIKDLIKVEDLPGSAMITGRLNDLFNNLFDELWSGNFDVKLFNDIQPKVAFPKVDIYETETSYEVTIAATGFSKEDLELEVKDNVLYIKGEVEQYAEEKDEEKKCLKKEISMRSFRRPLRFPVKINPESITCNYDEGNGLVKCVLGKLIEKKDETIKITIK